MINVFPCSVYPTLIHVIPRSCTCIARWLFTPSFLLFVFLFIRTWFVNVWHKIFIYVYIFIYVSITALLEEGRPSLNWSAFTTSAQLVSVDPKDFSCKGFFLRHPCLMSNALTVVSAILSRPYRFSSSNETELNVNLKKTKSNKF